MFQPVFLLNEIAVTVAVGAIAAALLARSARKVPEVVAIPVKVRENQ